MMLVCAGSEAGNRGPFVEMLSQSVGRCNADVSPIDLVD